VAFVSSLEFTIGLAFKLQGLGTLEEADELVGAENRADFDALILLGELKALARLEVQFSPDLFRYDDLVFR